MIPKSIAAGRLSALLDVLLSSPATGQVLEYNSVSQKWINAFLDAAYITGLGGGAFLSVPVPIVDGGTSSTNAFDAFLALWNDSTIPDNGSTPLDKNQYMLVWNKNPGGASSVYGQNIDGLITQVMTQVAAGYIAQSSSATISFIPQARSNTTNATGTVSVADSVGTYFANAVGGVVTYNLPTAVGRQGKRFTFKKIDASANNMTVVPNGAQTIDGAASKSTAVQYAFFTVESNNANWFQVA